MLVFAAETSCDETSICLMEDKKIVKHIIYSQEIHKEHGGVVPELASRSHLEKLQQITLDLFNEIKIKPNQIDVFAATCGPGLIGSLLVGSTFTKSLALNYNKPFIPVNHLEGHILSTSFNNNVVLPQLVILLTGGHTQIYLMKSFDELELLGESVDDAIGEAFDKTAKLLGMNYPGGAEIEKIAKHGNELEYDFPKPLINEENFNFSFSGIKTNISLLVKQSNLNFKLISDVAASFQKTISEILIIKINKGIKRLRENNLNIKSVSIVGGVSNNEYIRRKFEDMFKSKNIKLYFPIKEMMSDNAAMIAWACLKNFNIEKNNIYFKPNPRLKINEN